MKLQAENITKLCNGKKVLDQLQLTLEKGKIYGLTGRIGVGKTTLFSILSKQLLPDAGTVHLYDDNGRELDLTPGHVFFPEDLSLTIQEKDAAPRAFPAISRSCHTSAPAGTAVWRKRWPAAISFPRTKNWASCQKA